MKAPPLIFPIQEKIKKFLKGDEDVSGVALRRTMRLGTDADRTGTHARDLPVKWHELRPHRMLMLVLMMIYGVIVVHHRIGPHPWRTAWRIETMLLVGVEPAKRKGTH